MRLFLLRCGFEISDFELGRGFDKSTRRQSSVVFNGEDVRNIGGGERRSSDGVAIKVVVCSHAMHARKATANLESPHDLTCENIVTVKDVLHFESPAINVLIIVMEKCLLSL